MFSTKMTPRYIYILYNTVTKKKYVGSSKQPKQRFLEHIYALHGGYHKVSDMQSDYDEYGEHFKFTVVDYIKDKSENHKEYEWMRKLETYKRNYGYNYNDSHLIENYDNTKHYFKYKGDWLSITQLSELYGIQRDVISNRLLVLGWDIDKAISVPVKKYHRSSYYKTRKE